MNNKILVTVLLLLTLGLTGCNRLSSPKVNHLDGHPALLEGEFVNVVVEIPAGTNDKWEVEKTYGTLHWEQKDGKPRVVQYLAYPGNYGMIPRTSLPRELGGDGDPLDVLVLGPQVERGAVLHARPIGVLRLIDDGDRDDKILAVQTSGPLSDIESLEALKASYGGALLIIETWFTNYKGPGRLTSTGFGDATTAMAVVREASQYYEKNARHPK